MKHALQREISFEKHMGSGLSRDLTEIQRIKSQDLFQNDRELEIDHCGRIYKLRLTQLNKMILTA